MKRLVRTLTQAGIDRFSAWLDAPGGTAPVEMLDDPNYSEALDSEYWLDPACRFATAYALGEYLQTQVFTEPAERAQLRKDNGMWAWVSLALIDSLVRRDGKSVGRPLARAHYVDAGPRHAYRLIARTAWLLVGLHGEAARAALSSRSTPWGEMAEQLTSRQEVFAHTGMWSVACRLYLDSDGQVRRGATTQRSKQARQDPRNKSGLGGVRRLPRSFKQFDRTYNTREMSATEIIELLPSEYHRWKEAVEAA